MFEDLLRLQLPGQVCHTLVNKQEKLDYCSLLALVGA